MSVEQIFSVLEFLTTEITEEQMGRLIDEVKKLSISDQERVIRELPEGIAYDFYTDLSEYNAEMGGLSRY